MGKGNNRKRKNQNEKIVTISTVGCSGERIIRKRLKKRQKEKKKIKRKFHVGLSKKRRRVKIAKGAREENQTTGKDCLKGRISLERRIRNVKTTKNHRRRCRRQKKVGGGNRVSPLQE